MSHIAKNYWKPNPRRDEFQMAQEKRNDDSKQVLLMVISSQVKELQENCWYLDTICSTYYRKKILNHRSWCIN